VHPDARGQLNPGDGSHVANGDAIGWREEDRVATGRGRLRCDTVGGEGADQREAGPEQDGNATEANAHTDSTQ
jgi:hypothetical protein